MKVNTNICEIGAKTFANTCDEELMYVDKMYDYETIHYAIKDMKDFEKCEARYNQLREDWLKTFREDKNFVILAESDSDNGYYELYTIYDNYEREIFYCMIYMLVL